MEVLLLIVVVLVGAVGAYGAFVWARSRASAESVAPPRAWKSDTVTPIMMGPRSKAPERVARSFVATQGALLAARMANADGEIKESERDAIRAFLLEHVTAGDPAVAERALADAEARIHDEVALTSALEGLRAVGSEDQRRVLVELLVHVAQADGIVRPEEEAFMQRVGGQLGLSSDDVRARITLNA